MNKAFLVVLPFYSFTLRQRRTLNWTHVRQGSLQESLNKRCCPSGSLLGRRRARQPALICPCLGVPLGGWYHHPIIRTKGTAWEERSGTEREIRKGFLMGLGTLCSAWKTLVKVRQRRAGQFQGKEENAEAGLREHGWVAGEDGQVGEGLWPQTEMCHSMTRVSPSLLTLCLPPGTIRPHCLAEPTV